MRPRFELLYKLKSTGVQINLTGPIGRSAAGLERRTNRALDILSPPGKEVRLS
jgi:hypothetical protein